MVKFKIKKERLLEFLSSASMMGTYSFTSGKATKRAFFDSFFMDVHPEGKLVVLTLNKSRNTSAKFTLKDVDVVEDGIIPITDAEAIISVLKQNSVKSDLNIDSEGSIMTVSDGKSTIEIEQRESKTIDELKKDNIVAQLKQWDDYHEFNEEGTLVISKRHPQLKQDLPYPFRLVVKREELLPLIGTTLNLTKDNKTALIFDGTFRAKSVQANSRIKLKDTKITATAVGTPFNFEYEFYSLQAILPNLFDTIDINMKIAKAKEDDVLKSYLNLYIVSREPKTNIETIIAFSSIGKEDKPS